MPTSTRSGWTRRPGPTVWRTASALTGGTLPRIATARAAARRRVWAAGRDPQFSVIDIDGTWVTAHSDKEGARPPDKHGDGFTPLLASPDATGGPLAIWWHPGACRFGQGGRPYPGAGRPAGPTPAGSWARCRHCADR